MEINGGVLSSTASNTIYSASGSIVVINGGEISTTGICTIYGASGSSIVINNGTITGPSTNYPTVYTYANLEINGGEISSTASNTIYGASGSSIVINNGTITGPSTNYPTVCTYANLEINGGEIIGNNYCSVYVSDGSVTVNDGNLKCLADSSKSCWGVSCICGPGTVQINGGNLYSKCGWCLFVTGYSLEINDGTFTSNWETVEIVSGTFTVNGGTFNQGVGYDEFYVDSSVTYTDNR